MKKRAANRRAYIPGISGFCVAPLANFPDSRLLMGRAPFKTAGCALEARINPATPVFYNFRGYTIKLKGEILQTMVGKQTPGNSPKVSLEACSHLLFARGRVGPTNER